VKVKKLINTQA